MGSRKAAAILVGLLLLGAGLFLVLRKASIRAETAFDVASSRTGAIPWESVKSVSPPPAGVTYLLCPFPLRAAAVWEGRLVVATPAGLMVHSGAGRFETFGPGRGLAPSDLTALASSGGELWAATRDNGLYRIRRDWAEALTIPGGPKSNAVRAMASGGGVVFAATAGGVWSIGRDGVVKVSGRQDVSAMAVNPSTGAVMAGTGDGTLLFLEPGANPELKVFGHLGHSEVQSGEGPATGSPVRALFAEGAGFLAGTAGIAFRVDSLGGISTAARNVNVSAFAIVNGESWVLSEDGWAFRLAALPGSPNPSGRVEDGTARSPAWIRGEERPIAAGMVGAGFFLVTERGVWTGSDFPGLLKGRGNPWNPEPGSGESHSLSSPIVSAARDTRSGVLVGHFDGGVDFVGADGRVSWRSGDDSRLREVNAIRLIGETSAGICTSTGLAIIDLGELPGRAAEGAELQGRIGIQAWIPGAARLAGPSVYDVFPTDDGALAIASSGGITILDPSAMKARHITVLNGLPGNRVYTLAGHGSGFLAGTLSGIAMVDNCTVTSVWDPATSGLPAPWVTAVAGSGPDEPGMVLVGTYGGGGAVWNTRDPGEVSRSRPVRDGSSNRNTGAWTIHGRGAAVGFNAAVSIGGVRLFGTLDRGIMVVGGREPDGIQRYFAKWLPSLSVNALARARGDAVIAGTGAGMVSIPLREILENAE